MNELDPHTRTAGDPLALRYSLYFLLTVVYGYMYGFTAVRRGSTNTALTSVSFNRVQAYGTPTAAQLTLSLLVSESMDGKAYHLILVHQV